MSNGFTQNGQPIPVINTVINTYIISLILFTIPCRGCRDVLSCPGLITIPCCQMPGNSTKTLTILLSILTFLLVFFIYKLHLICIDYIITKVCTSIFLYGNFQYKSVQKSVQKCAKISTSKISIKPYKLRLYTILG